MPVKKKTRVAVLSTRSESILEDYSRLMHLAEYERFVPKSRTTILKLNLSWTKYFPSSSSQPWQVEGVVRTLINDGFSKENLVALENKTLVTDPRKGAINNKWLPALKRYGLDFVSLPEVEWIRYKFKSKFLRIDRIFHEGIEIPKMFIGKNIIHLPTVKTHGHSITTGAIKNSFGGLLKEVRHYAHKYIHEVLVDLMLMQKELHPAMFVVMDGTICGDGAGPRTMMPRIKNYILASSDPVAIDSVSAKMMGFEPMQIPYIRLCHEMGLGIGKFDEIEVIGEDISCINFGFKTKKSLVIWGDQMLRKGALKFLERPLLHSPLIIWAPIASNFYHDYLWYGFIGRNRIKEFMNTDWGKLFKRY